jgi:hypothetical protein
MVGRNVCPGRALALTLSGRRKLVQQEGRAQRWVMWRRRLRHVVLSGLLTAGCSAPLLHGDQQSAPPSQQSAAPGLAGEWELSDGNIEGTLSLDCQGMGRYDWQDGRVVTTIVRDHYWAGTWHQAGNDREGGFEVLLSDDRTRAEGHWWYSRIGDERFVPGERGGAFRLTRPAHARQIHDECRPGADH